MGNACNSKMIRMCTFKKRAVRFVFDLEGSQACSRYVFRNNKVLNFPSIYILELVTP